MPAQAAAGAGGAPPAQQEERGNQNAVQQLIRGVLFFFAIQAAMKYISGGGNAPGGSGGSGGSSGASPDSFASRPARDEVRNYSRMPQVVQPIWPAPAELDVQIYAWDGLAVPPLAAPAMQAAKIFDAHVTWGNWETQAISVSVDVPLSASVQHNGSVFAHVFAGRRGAVLDPLAAGYDPAAAWRQVAMLNRYLPKKKAVRKKKLVGGGGDEADEADAAPAPEDAGPVVASYWSKNLTLELVQDEKAIPYPTLQQPVAQHIVLEQTGARDASGQNGWYYPILYVNDFWTLRDHLLELNTTTPTAPLHINLHATSFWKFQIYASMDFSFKQSAANPNTALGQGASTGAELEEFKRILIDTNVYLLGTTFFVSILHTIFEMLAFKNDIAHWRAKKDNVGVSVRTILANVFMQAVIFLYLLDNSEGTSWMILFGQGMGIVLEAWKITRTVDVRVLPAPPGAWLPYRVAFEDKHKLSALELETQRYDREAFDYMKWLMVPLLLAYAAYSLLYESHKSWYSYLIATLVGSVYAYGFLMMVPGLYINYKLKSVAHMPRKTMVYKLLNTFIDDLFAFTIKMPTLHRLATLRDDVIYFIALYQSWIYRVDMRRRNEFGQGGGDGDVEDVELLREAAAKKDEDAGGTGEGAADAPAAKAKASGVEGKKGAAKRR